MKQNIYKSMKQSVFDFVEKPNPHSPYVYSVDFTQRSRKNLFAEVNQLNTMVHRGALA